MDLEILVSNLDHLQSLTPWLKQIGFANFELAQRNLRAIVGLGLPEDLAASLMGQLTTSLTESSDPDVALNNLERFIQASRSPIALVGFFDRDPAALQVLIKIFSIGQYLADQLIRDPESFDLLRLTEGKPVARDLLVDEICSEVRYSSDESQVMRILRAYKHRETLRIAYGDFIGGLSIETVTEQISWLAEAICEAALQAALRDQIARRGHPMIAPRIPAKFAILALGKLGGSELNYSSDIDLIFIAETEGRTDSPRPVPNEEFFERLAQQFLRLLTENTPLGHAYRVDLRLRPFGAHGKLVVSHSEGLRYYDSAGRTWERQAFVKARSIAGDQPFGKDWLEQLEPWIYRRYLSRADIGGIRALKRRMEARPRVSGDDNRDVKHGRGGIRDIEFAIQFLQLLNGGDLHLIRLPNTLQAIARLEQVGCLTPQERSILESNYCFLRRIEHLLQIMFDRQSYTLPIESGELQKLALRAGFKDEPPKTALEAFQFELHTRTSLNRRILDHLLHDAFSDDEDVSEEADLILDPEPSPELIAHVLERHRFRDPNQAYARLLELSREDIAFLSTRRCRHFLAAIAPKLLECIAQTPDPDTTLLNLARISDSLGGKAVLWELFSFHRPSMDLCVRLCACSPYLTSILTSNPGMIDELMDSLMLNRLPSIENLDAMMADLCRGADDIEPIVHNFKNSMHLRVGVRDILAKEDIVDAHRALSDIAEICLQAIIGSEYQKLVRRFGVPTIDEGSRKGAQSEFIVLALGNLGGREPNYHSDLDVIFLFNEDGTTRSLIPSRRDNTTTNRHFFNQLAQRVIYTTSRLTPWGKLYDLDTHMRPSGKAGTLAISVEDLANYFADGRGQLWERQSLCKARSVWGSENARLYAMDAVHRIIKDVPWQIDTAESIRGMRIRMQQDASDRNLKRGVGGTVDVEFAVQMLQLENASLHPDVLSSGTLEAIRALARNSILSSAHANQLWDGYHFLRSIESGLRLLNTTARHDLPDSAQELERLAFLLGFDSAESIVERCDAVRYHNRQIFNELFDQRRRDE